MPIFDQREPFPNAKITIWHITEPESFFSKHSGLKAEHIKHPQRRIEFLAGRYLLSLMAPDLPISDIITGTNKKPCLPGNRHHFSISHSFPYVACYYHADQAVGIDIQCWHPRILSLRHKFLSPAEQALFGEDEQMNTLAWCGKEAAFKFQNLAGVDFIKHLPVSDFSKGAEDYYFKINLNLTSPLFRLNLKGLIFNDFSFAYTI